MSEAGDEFLDFALAEGKSDRKNAEDELLAMRESSKLWKREGRERCKGTSAAEDVDNVFCANRDGALVVVVKVVVREEALSECVLKRNGREEGRGPSGAA